MTLASLILVRRSARTRGERRLVLLAADRLNIEREVFLRTREGNILPPGAKAIIGRVPPAWRRAHGKLTGPLGGAVRI